MASSSSRRFSLFSQPLDRAAFIAYFLGAVLPLIFLAYLAQRFVIPAVPGARALYVPLIAFLALLSLGSFLALRRTARQALERLDDDNRRLAHLLEASRVLAGSDFDRDVLRSAVQAAARLAGTGSGFYFERSGEEGPPAVVESTGRKADELFDRHRQALQELAARALDGRHPAAIGGAAEGAGSPLPIAAAAVPLGGRHGRCGALLVADDGGRGEAATDVQTLATLAALASVALRNADLKEAQRNFFTHTTHLLVAALDSQLDYKGEHSAQVARLAVRLGRALGFPEERLERLHFAALLHDIGMLGVDRTQAARPQVVREHPRRGFEMLQNIQLWQDLAPFVLHHHEYYDGRGYPDGLAGDAIPLESRIIGLAEAFDSMTNAASYQPRISTTEALRRIEEAAGSQFDPELARRFVELLGGDELDETGALQPARAVGAG